MSVLPTSVSTSSNMKTRGLSSAWRQRERNTLRAGHGVAPWSMRIILTDGSPAMAYRRRPFHRSDCASPGARGARLGLAGDAADAVLSALWPTVALGRDTSAPSYHPRPTGLSQCHHDFADLLQVDERFLGSLWLRARQLTWRSSGCDYSSKPMLQPALPAPFSCTLSARSPFAILSSVLSGSA